MDEKGMSAKRLIAAIIMLCVGFGLLFVAGGNYVFAETDNEEKEVIGISCELTEDIEVYQNTAGLYLTDENGKKYWFYLGFDEYNAYSNKPGDSLQILNNYEDYYYRLLKKYGKIIIKYKDGYKETYTWKEVNLGQNAATSSAWGWYSKSNEKIFLYINKSDQEKKHWTINSDNYYIMLVSKVKIVDGCEYVNEIGSVNIPVKVVKNNIKAVSFEAENEYLIREFTADKVDANGKAYHEYEYGIPGGVITVEYSNGDIEEYPYIWDEEYQDNIQYEIPFEYYDDQLVNHWKKGKTNYFYISIGGKVTKHPVKIVENSVKSVTCKLSEPLSITLADDYFNDSESGVDENGNAYRPAFPIEFSSLYDEIGSKLTATVTFSDGETVNVKGNIESTFNYDGDSYNYRAVNTDERWTEGTNYFRIDVNGIKSEPIPFTLKVSHNYGEPDWKWTGNTKAEAIFTCKNNLLHQKTVKATVTSKVTTTATCTSKGQIVYTAKVKFNNKTYTTTRKVTIAATGHKYGTPTWKWTGYTKAVARFTCNNDSSHVKELTANITSVITTKPTLTKAGVKTYTATVKLDDKTYKSTKTQTIYLFDKSKNGLQKYNNELYYVKDGFQNTSFTGFAKYGSDWYYVVKGKVDTTKKDVLKGTVNGSEGWWFISGGKVQFVDSVEKNSSGWWCIQKGKVNFNYTGFAKNSSGWWYCESGKVNFDKKDVLKGTVNGETAWWFVSGGKVQFINSVEKNSLGWWCIQNGKVNFNFTGIASNSLGSWYCKGGQVQFGYSGTVNYNGKKYTIKDGKVVN